MIYFLWFVEIDRESNIPPFELSGKWNYFERKQMNGVFTGEVK